MLSAFKISGFMTEGWMFIDNSCQRESCTQGLFKEWTDGLFGYDCLCVEMGSVGIVTQAL